MSDHVAGILLAVLSPCWVAGAVWHFAGYWNGRYDHEDV